MVGQGEKEEREGREGQGEKEGLNALPQQVVSSQEVVSLWRGAVPSSDTHRFVSYDRSVGTWSRPCLDVLLGVEKERESIFKTKPPGEPAA